MKSNLKVLYATKWKHILFHVDDLSQFSMKLKGSTLTLLVNRKDKLVILRGVCYSIITLRTSNDRFLIFDQKF